MKNKFLFNILYTRLPDYKKQLQYALFKGYQVGTVCDFLKRENDSPYIILRHDVDIRHIGIKKMIDIEKSLGIASSWYFRWSTAEKQIINKIQREGGEVGLHYETLAIICDEYNIKDRKSITPVIIQKARNRLINEIKKFRRSYNTVCRTIASHGHLTNQKIKMANNELIDKKFYRMAGIDAETYDQDLLSSVDCYISDANLLKNYGWAYGLSLGDAIRKQYRIIYFLSHPNHWEYSNKDKVKLLLRWVLQGVSIEERKFKSKFDGLVKSRKSEI